MLLNDAAQDQSPYSRRPYDKNDKAASRDNNNNNPMLWRVTSDDILGCLPTAGATAGNPGSH